MLGAMGVALLIALIGSVRTVRADCHPCHYDAAINDCRTVGVEDCLCCWYP